MIYRFLGLVRRYLSTASSVSFWHTPIDQVVYEYKSLNDYYIDLTGKCSYSGPFDDQGIPVLDYTGEIGKQYNPCASSQYALGWFQLWRRGKYENARKIFFELADWLCATQALEDGKGYWLYHFDMDAYGVTAPWKSGLAQAQAVSVLCRAVKFAEDDDCKARYEKALTCGFSGLIENVDEGGLLLTEGQDVWIEEVVAARRAAILDGCMFALFGVRDYADLTNSTEAEKVFEDGCSTIVRYLPTFDLGYWSRADLYQDNPPPPASQFYHNLHVNQLKVLYALTGEDEFLRYAEKWDLYQKSWLNRKRAFITKAIFKVRYY